MMQQRNSSSTMQPLANLPTNLLEAFIPGYGTISAFLFEAFGFDITLIVSAAFLLFALIKSAEYLRHQSLKLLIRFGMCSIAMDSTGDAYHWLTNWLAVQGVGKACPDLLAISNLRSTGWEVGIEVDGEFVPQVIGSGEAENRPKVWYEPCLGSSQYFWHNGRLFLWYRWKDQRVPENRGFDPDLTGGKIEARLYCLSRSTAPIKALIQNALDAYQKRQESKTSIRRPAPSKQRRNGGNPWVKVATRPSRSMDTIVLDEGEKERILADMTEYLALETRQWYAGRGIPYRRGYLFYGPPGTGKTSLSFSLAGVFGLDIYCISLAESSITEEDLASLFDVLPERCLVLLEDIDSAGLPFRGKLKVRQPKEASPAQDVEEDDSHLSTPWPEDEMNLAFEDDGKFGSMTDDHGISAPSSRNRISLSGLLNVIDGVASHEGRLLIMTTNHIARLDSALLRPGRIDARVRFDLATRKDAEHLFVQMFTVGRDNGGIADVPSEKASMAEYPGSGGLARKRAIFRAHEIADMAREFAVGLPDRTLSAAEIQGFLMIHKSRPDKAVTNAEKWMRSRTSREALQ